MILKALALALAVGVILGFGLIIGKSIDDLSESIQKVRDERLDVGPR